MYDQYTQRIYQILNEYMAEIATNNQTQADNSGIIAGIVEEIKDYLVELVDLVTSVHIDVSDVSKYLLWFLFAFLSTKILRWGFRI